jgi:putative oxidoreductase
MSTLTAPPTASPQTSAWTKVLATSSDYGATISRLALGIMILPHGAQKALGWFGGYGFTGTITFFTQTMHVPAPLAVLAIAAEFLGGLGLITGLFSRVAAFGVGFNMLVAVLMVHLPNGFFMNWFGHQKGEGIEFFILAIGLAVAVMIKGGGALSLDRWLTHRKA